MFESNRFFHFRVLEFRFNAVHLSSLVYIYIFFWDFFLDVSHELNWIIICTILLVFVWACQYHHGVFCSLVFSLFNRTERWSSIRVIFLVVVVHHSLIFLYTQLRSSSLIHLFNIRIIIFKRERERSEINKKFLIARARIYFHFHFLYPLYRSNRLIR